MLGVRGLQACVQGEMKGNPMSKPIDRIKKLVEWLRGEHGGKIYGERLQWANDVENVLDDMGRRLGNAIAEARKYADECGALRDELTDLKAETKKRPDCSATALEIAGMLVEDAVLTPDVVAAFKMPFPVRKFGAIAKFAPMDARCVQRGEWFCVLTGDES